MCEKSGVKNDCVHIVIVNYNDGVYISNCINSLLKQTYKSIVIHVIDNDSNDGSMELIHNLDNIDIICLDNNIGWGGASNIGIKRALMQGAEYILLLNTDTFAMPDMIEVLMNDFRENEIAVPKIFQGFVTDSNVRYENYSTWYSGGTLTDTANVNQNLYPLSSDIKDVDFISGCCMLTSKFVFDSIGYFDERYFLYGEDVDFCIRAKKNGIHLKYNPGAHLFHAVGGSQGGEISSISVYYSLRNRLHIAGLYEGFKSSGDIIRDYMLKRDVPALCRYSECIVCAINDFYHGVWGKSYTAFKPEIKKDEGDCIVVSYLHGFGRNYSGQFKLDNIEVVLKNSTFSISNISDADCVVRVTYAASYVRGACIKINCDGKLIDEFDAGSYSGFKYMIAAHQIKYFLVLSDNDEVYKLINIKVLKTDTDSTDVTRDDVEYVYNKFFFRDVESEDAMKEKLKAESYGELVRIVFNSEEFSSAFPNRILQSVIL